MSQLPNHFVGRRVRLTAPRPEDSAVLAQWSENAKYLRQMDTDVAISRPPIFYAHGPDNNSGTLFEFRIRPLDSDRLVGLVAVHSIEWSNRLGKLAIGIGDVQDRNRGYGTEALRLALRYAFHELNLNRVGVEVIGSNSCAVHVYQKVGFQREGVVRAAVLRDQRSYDLVLMGILRDEWERSSYTEHDTRNQANRN